MFFLVKIDIFGYWIRIVKGFGRIGGLFVYLFLINLIIYVKNFCGEFVFKFNFYSF